MRLDEAYSNAAYIPDGSTYPEKWSDQAQEFREVETACGRALLNQPYGNGQAYDLFLPSARPAGCMIFVHGGYWKAFDRKDFSHLAAGVMDHDWACAMPGYPLCPDATIPEIVRCIRDAIEAIAADVPGPITLAGHSAGGHLVARMAMADVGLAPAVAGRVRHIVPISPVGDLRDLLETSMIDPLRLDPATAVSESPTLGAKALDVPTTIWVGGDERPKFLEQARGLASAWGDALIVDDGRHHFDIIEPLMDPSSAMVSRLTGRQP